MSGLAGVVVGNEQDQVYHLKPINFLGREIAILLQNSNGPCPLLAICNCLILENRLEIHPDRSMSGLDELVQLLGALILDMPSANSAEEQQQVEDVIQTLPSLAEGLDVNVQFCKGVTGFEYTRQFTPFDKLGIDVLHGWLVDPDSSQVYSTMRDMTYNHAVEKLIALHSVSENAVNSAESSEPIDQETLSNSSPSANSTPESVINQGNCSANSRGEDDGLWEGTIVDRFMKASASQLTFYGLTQLHEHIRERQVAVLFRNNHFNTIFKLDGRLYVLVTDVGYVQEASVVWECLHDVNGDTEYVNSSFQVPPPKQQTDPEQHLVDPDFLYALQLDATPQPSTSALEVLSPEANDATPQAEANSHIPVRDDPPSYEAIANLPQSTAVVASQHTETDEQLAQRLQAEFNGIPPPQQNTSDESFAWSLQQQEIDTVAHEAPRNHRAHPQERRNRPETPKAQPSASCSVQ